MGAHLCHRLEPGSAAVDPWADSLLPGHSAPFRMAQVVSNLLQRALKNGQGR